MLSSTLETIHKWGKWTSSFPSTTCWRCFFFFFPPAYVSDICVNITWLKLHVFRLKLHLQFCSIDLPVCSCTRIISFSFKTMALQSIIRSGIVIHPELFFLFRIVLAILRLSGFHMNCRIIFVCLLFSLWKEGKNEMWRMRWRFGLGLNWICK